MTPEEEKKLTELRASNPDTSCEAVGASLTPDVAPTAPTIPCDDPLERPEDTFYPPFDAGSDYDDKRLPDPLVVRHADLLLLCELDQVHKDGYPAEVHYAAGQLAAAEQLVYLDSIPEITLRDLYRIRFRVQELQALVDASLSTSFTMGSWESFDAEVSVVLGVTAPIAVAIRDALAAAQSVANSIVAAKASSDLKCEWQNRKLRVECDDDEELGYSVILASDEDPLGHTYTDVGITRSAESQYEADLLAARLAAIGLTCLHGNRAITVTCEMVDEVAFLGPHGDAPGVTLLWPTDASDELTYRAPVPTPLYSLDGEEFETVALLPEGRRKLILTYTVAAGTIEGATIEEADRLALELALASLDCFVPSRPQIFSCTDDEFWPSNPEDRRAIEDEDLNEMVTGDIHGDRQLVMHDNEGLVALLVGKALDVRVGVRAVIPPGMFTADTESEVEATADAFGASTLECQWGNRKQEYACDDIGNVPANTVTHRSTNYPGALVRANKKGQLQFSSALNTSLLMLASPSKSPNYDEEVGARVFHSYISQLDADTIAGEFAVSQLQCVYCNPRIPPVCLTLVEDSGYTLDTVPLPVPPELIAANQSADATMGVPGIPYIDVDGPGDAPWEPFYNFFDPIVGESSYATFSCGTDATEPLNVADVIGAIPMRDITPQDTHCRYGNDLLRFSCQAVAGFDDVVTPGDAEFDAYLSDRSRPALDEFVTINPDTFMVEAAAGEADGPQVARAAANAQARAVGLSQLECFFESPAMTLYCGANMPSYYGYAPEFRAPSLPINLGNGLVNEAPVSHNSSGSVNPDTGIVLSYGLTLSKTSPQDAMERSFLIGLVQLDCFFENAKVSLQCGAKKSISAEQSDQNEYGDITSGVGKDSYGFFYSYDSNAILERWIKVSAGTFRSYTSQVEVNTLAYGLAYPQLDCFYQNARVDMTCYPSPKLCSFYRFWHDTENKPYDSIHTHDQAQRYPHPEAGSLASCITVPAPKSCFDTIPHIIKITGKKCVWGDPHSVAYSRNSNGETYGEVIVVAKSFMSRSSQYECNNAAWMEAYNQLDCFFESARVDLRCTALTTLGPQGGSNICVAPPFMHLLDYHCNAEATKENAYCIHSGSRMLNEDVPGKRSDLYAMRSNGAKYTDVFVAASAAISYVNQNVANEQAYAMAYGQLDCWFESAKIMLKCGAPPLQELSFNEANADSEETIVKGNGTLIGQTGLCSARSQGSTSYIVLEKGSVSNKKSQQDVNAAAYAIALTMLDCFYSSAAVNIYCGAPNITFDTNGMEITSILDPAYSEESFGYKSPITIPWDSYQSYRSQLEANRLAYSAAVSQLDCFYSSAEVKIYCGAPASTSYEGKDPIFHALDSSYDKSSRGYNEPASAAAKSFQSYASQLEANVTAYAVALNQLDCFWSNEEQTYECDSTDGLTDGSTKPSKVKARYEKSYDSKAEANQLAKELAKSRRLCIYASEAQLDTDCGELELLKAGFVEAGAALSSVSLEDANSIAKAMAAAYTRCRDPKDPNYSIDIEIGGGASGGDTPGHGKGTSCGCSVIRSIFNNEKTGELVEVVRFSPCKVVRADTGEEFEVDYPDTNNAGGDWWYVKLEISDGVPSSAYMVTEGQHGAVDMSGSHQSAAYYPMGGKGCGNLRAVQGFFNGYVAWMLVP